MELLTLNSAFQPEKIIENYESLIWTERYSRNGDFELTSSDIAGTINALPLESYVTLRDTTVPMVVEIHKIEKNIQGEARLTVKGRSFETVLERRVSANTLPAGAARVPWLVDAEKESDAAYKAMRIVIGDFPRYQTGVEVLALTDPAVSPYDAIPEVDLILPADYSTLTTNTYEIKLADLYSTVIGLLDINRRGMKAVRPEVGDEKIGIEIYNGADLTSDVVFDARFDQFDDTKYLLSNQGSMNVGYIYGANGSSQILKTAGPEPSGLVRRVLSLDETSDSTSNSTEIRQTRGLIELYKYNATALFDGQIAIQVAAGYNTSYFLGDIINLTGEYGLSQIVRVAEFIRTSDANGEKSFPTFEAVS